MGPGGHGLVMAREPHQTLSVKGTARTSSYINMVTPQVRNTRGRDERLITQILALIQGFLWERLALRTSFGA